MSQTQYGIAKRWRHELDLLQVNDHGWTVQEIKCDESPDLTYRILTTDKQLFECRKSPDWPYKPPDLFRVTDEATNQKAHVEVEDRYSPAVSIESLLMSILYQQD